MRVTSPLAFIATNIVGGKESQNEDAKKAIAFAEKWGMDYAILDMRVTKKADAQDLLGTLRCRLQRPAPEVTANIQHPLGRQVRRDAQHVPAGTTTR